MVDIRIRDLPDGGGPVASDYLAIDNGSTRRASVQDVVEIGRPAASQAEAEAGTNPTKVMTPLTVKQSIASEVGVTLASAAQGLLASTAVQPSRSVNTGAGLTGGGDLSADRTIALSAASIVSLALADGAAQKAQNLADLADKGTAQDNIQIGAVFADIATATAATIPTRNKRIRTQCYDSGAAKRQGGANYRESSASEVAKYPSRGWFTSNGGTRYWLLDELFPNAHQFGGIGNGVADDAVALQQLLDFWSPQAQLASGTVTTRPLAMAGGGPVHIPKGVWRHTTTLFQNAYVSIHGDGMAMFPQAPMDGTTYGQYNFPNATILRPDFAAPDRALGVGIQTSPYILTLSGASASLAGQTVGTRFRSLLVTPINGFDIDNGCINYCEGADIKDLTVWPVNEIFSGIRWTAASNSKIERVGSRNVMRGIFTESAWESVIYEPKIFDFKNYGIYGGGNLHSVVVEGGWIHGGGRVLAGDRPVCFFATDFNGLVIDGVAMDDAWDAIQIQTGAGAQINGVHSERISNVWLTTNNAFGVRGGGNHIIQNVVDARTFTNSIIWDGNNCEVDIQVSASDTALGTGTFPGKSYLQGVNPNTGANTFLVSATGNRTSVTFNGMRPLSGDAVRVNRLSGNIRFLDDTGERLIAGTANGNVYTEEVNVRGDTNVQWQKDIKVNGVRKSYMISDAAGITIFEDTSNDILFRVRYSDNALLFGGGLPIIPVFGTPNGFTDGPATSVAFDTANLTLWVKQTAPGTLTGWVPVLGTGIEATAAQIASAAATINTTAKYLGKKVWDTTNNRELRARGSSATSPWDLVSGGTTVTPV